MIASSIEYRGTAYGGFPSPRPMTHSECVWYMQRHGQGPHEIVLESWRGYNYAGSVVQIVSGSLDGEPEVSNYDAFTARAGGHIHVPCNADIIVGTREFRVPIDGQSVTVDGRVGTFRWHGTHPIVDYDDGCARWLRVGDRVTLDSSTPQSRH